MDILRIGIIGLGNMGSAYARMFRSGDFLRSELTAVCDIVPAKLEPYADLKTFTDSAELIRSGEVDAVMIVTPHYFHTTIGIDALGQGLHVLTDKPISVHKADCQRLIAAHTDDKLVFAAMFNQRTDPHYLRLKKLIDDGELGQIRRINWIITDWFRTEIYYQSGGWRATWGGEGGGVLLNQCPHNLDLWQWMFGMPQSVRAWCHLGKHHDIEVEDEVTACMEYANGATGVFITSTGEAPGTNRLEVTGERGKVVVESGTIRFTRNEVPTSQFSRETDQGFARPDVWHCEIPVSDSGPQHAGIIRNFVDAALDGAPLIAPAAEGIHSVELGNAMLYSSLINSPVDMPLDAAAFEAKLQELIQSSTHTKAVREVGQVDMGQSFSRP